MKIKFLKRIYNEGSIYEKDKVYSLDDKKVAVFSKEDYVIIEDKKKKDIKTAKNTAIKSEETKQK